MTELEQNKKDFKSWWEENKKVLEDPVRSSKEVALAAWTECTKTGPLPCKKIPYCAKRFKPNVTCDSHCDYYKPFLFSK